MSIFAIGDLHLSLSVDKPMDVFGLEWADHHNKIKANWESLIKPDDTVIIAGDISWALKFEEASADLEWIHNLPGKKVLIRGNHDLWWAGIGKLNSLYDDMFFLQNNHYECGDIAICGSRGWTDPRDPDFNESDEKIYRRELIRMEMSLQSAAKAGFDDIIVAIHYPPALPGGEAGSEFTRLFEKYPVTKVVYGHLHGEMARKKGITGMHNAIDYKLVAVDAVDFSPVLLVE